MSVMGGEQAARTMAQVALEGAEKKGLDPKKSFCDGPCVSKNLVVSMNSYLRLRRQ